MEGEARRQTVYAAMNVSKAYIPEIVVRSCGRRVVLESEEKWQLFSYPYFLFQAVLESEKKASKVNTSPVFYVIDGIKGYFSFTPGLVDCGDEGPPEGSILLPPALSLQEAMDLGARDFREHSRFNAYALMLSPEIQIRVVTWQLIYKPYWLVEFILRRKRVTKVIDGTTGELGGFQGYRVMQGIRASASTVFRMPLP